MIINNGNYVNNVMIQIDKYVIIISENALPSLHNGSQN